MSLAQFDEILEICCEYMVLDEMARKEEEKDDSVGVRTNQYPVEYDWCDHGVPVREIESELLTV
jgi:hypothetical protein